MPTKLTIFNGAIRHLRREPLSDTEAQKKDARILRANWEPAILYCLEEAGWPVAKRRSQLAKLAETPAFGHDFYYDKPNDWLKTLHVSSDGMETGKWPLFEDEGDKIATGESAIYMLYVSTDAISDLGHWPQRLADYVSAYLAIISCEQITGSTTRAEKIWQTMEKIERQATSDAARSQPPKRIPRGTWARAAMGIGYSSRSRENG